MSHFTRRIIFWSFSLIFIILTFYFSLLVSGYTISFSDIKHFPNLNLLQKTGILSINSNPRGADVYLTKNFKTFLVPSDTLKAKNIKTPNKIKGLVPGDYSLRLELDGYWDFEQKINISPGQTTYLEDVNLFKKSLPLLIFPTSVQEISISDDYSSIILKDSNSVFNIKSETDFFDSKFFLSNELLEINSFSDILDVENIKNYFLSRHYLFLIKTEASKKYLNIYFNRDKKLLREIEMPVNSAFEIVSFNGKFLLVKDLNFSSFYIIDPFSKIKIFRKVLLDVKNVSFISRNNFIYSNNFEIYFFDYNNLQSTLASRFQDEIRSLIWHPREYIIFSNGRDINIIDLKYNKRLTTLFSFENMSNIVLDKRGGVLYFTAKLGSQEGLYKLLIQ